MLAFPQGCTRAMLLLRTREGSTSRPRRVRFGEGSALPETGPAPRPAPPIGEVLREVGKQETVSLDPGTRLARTSREPLPALRLLSRDRARTLPRLALPPVFQW